MNTPLFPLMNISISKLNNDNIEHLIIGDKYHYPKSKWIDFFNEFYLDNEFVDCNGNVFKLIGTQNSAMLQRLLHLGKEELVFKYTGKKMTFIQVQEFLINRYKTWDDDIGRPMMIDFMKKADDIRGLIG